MMSKHTPGEWTVKGPSKVAGRSDQSGDFAIVAENCIIAETFHQVSGTRFEPAEANAHLIAAAPDLYAAAKRIADKILYNGDCFGEDEAALIRAVQIAEGKR